MPDHSATLETRCVGVIDQTFAAHEVTGYLFAHSRGLPSDQVGNVVSQTNYVYGYAYQVPAGKTLVSVTLPKNSNLGILGMAIP